MYRTWWDCNPGAQAPGFGRVQPAEARIQPASAGFSRLQRTSHRIRPDSTRSVPFRPVPSRSFPSRSVPSEPGTGRIRFRGLSSTTWFGAFAPNPSRICGFLAWKGPEVRTLHYPVHGTGRTDGTGRERDRRDGTGRAERAEAGRRCRMQEAGSRKQEQ